MSKWYCRVGNKQHGPFDDKGLKQLVAKDGLSPNDLVRRDDMEDWIKARKIKGLFTAEELAAHPIQVTTKSAPSFRIGMAVGGLLLIGGAFFAIRYFMMDTSVAVDGGGLFQGGRVHNIGLMDEKRNGLLFSLAVAGFGFVMMILNRTK